MGERTEIRKRCRARVRARKTRQSAIGCIMRERVTAIDTAVVVGMEMKCDVCCERKLLVSVEMVKSPLSVKKYLVHLYICMYLYIC